MSNLPSENKVQIRIKTSSIKRPNSCIVDVPKKESKGLFSLKKGSSNLKLNERVEEEDAKKYALAKNNAIEEEKVKRMQGRKFNSDDEDDDLSNKETSVTKMAKLFENSNQVLNNPALLGYLLTYLVNHSMDYYSLLYYLVVQHYKTTTQLKEFRRDASRFATEIITTFIHEKSNLKLIHKIDTATILEDLRTNNNLVNIFNKSQEEIFKLYIQNSIKRLQQCIKNGLFTLEVSVYTFNFDLKMNFLNKCISNIVKNLEDKMIHESSNSGTREIKESDEYMSDIIISIKTALATIYYYYSKKEKDDCVDNISLVSNKHFRASMFMRSTENLQTMNNFEFDKYPTFCSKIHKNKPSYNLFRKPKGDIKLKGHNFQECIIKYPAECFCCTKLLWGINPQGLCCSHCEEVIHISCKDHVLKMCSNGNKKSFTNQSKASNVNEEETYKMSGDDIINVSSQISFNVIGNDLRNRQNVNDENVYQSIFPCKNEKHSEFSSFEELNVAVSNTEICITNNDDLQPIKYDSEFVDQSLDINHAKGIEYSKSDVQHKHNYRSTEKSHVKDLVSKIDSSTLSRSQSDDNMREQTKYLKPGTNSVYVQDLIVDLNLWTNDADMNIEETFEASKELQSFPEHISRDDNKSEYTRLLVLMEFHHKIKFTIMTLKRFYYLLIIQWPSEDTTLKKYLCLDSIIPLYELIKTLNITIETSKQLNSYSDNMARDVLNWLILDNESNLELWLKYSIDLCCTNSLNCVKNSWKELLTDPIYNKVLTKRYNKMIMVEQLSNMRPLLFNLPLIVSKILKNLSKFTDFKDETKLWEVILEKFKKLPTFIDEHCMPLVQLINKGIILNSMDRNSWSIRSEPKEQNELYDYIVDFPKTAFHYRLFDYQEIKITNFKTAGAFVKEMIDAFVICYEHMLVFLQKENDKYYLKQFKTSDTSKINPIFSLNNVHLSKGDGKGPLFELTLIFIDIAVLAQITFTKKDVMERWHDFIFLNKNKSKTETYQFSANNHIATTIENKTNESKLTSHNTENNVDLYSELKNKFEEFSQFHSSFFKQNFNIGDFDDVSQLFPIPNDTDGFNIGTSYDALYILNNCYNSLQLPANDAIENLLPVISTMKNRIANFMKPKSKDIINAEDIECELTDVQRGVVNVFQNQFSSIHLDEKYNINDEIISNEEDKQDMYFSNDDENISKFVDEYINQILEDTQLILNGISNYSNLSNDQVEPSVIQVSSVFSETSG